MSSSKNNQPAIFRFVHTADVHLDSPLNSLALRQPELAELVRSATHTTFERIVQLCMAEQVDALLIAGDLYDGEQKSMHTAAMLVSQFRLLDAAGIRVFIIHGNHDAASVITRQLAFPPNVHVFDNQLRKFELEKNNTVVHGVSFDEPNVSHSLLPQFESPVDGAFNIGMLHTNLGGSRAHDQYAPSTISELHATGFDYWALGHIHIRSEHQGASTIVMPGIPQGRDIGESGPRSVTLASVSEDHQVTTEQHLVAPVQFERVDMDISDTGSAAELDNQIENALKACREQCETDHVIARVVLNGASPLHHYIERDNALVLETARAMAAGIGNIWVEQIRNRTQRAGVDGTAASGATDASADILEQLARLIDSDLLNDPELLAEALNQEQLLTKKLPRGPLKDLFGKDQDEREKTVRHLMKQGGETLLSQLLIGE